jgi:hypothetical protein
VPMPSAPDVQKCASSSTCTESDRRDIWYMS